MRRLFLIFKNDIKRRLKSPLVIVVLLITPIIITGIIGAVFSPKSGKSQLPKIKILMVDKDKDIGSNALLKTLNSSQLKNMFEITMVDESKGNDLISKGKASALITIPENFTEKMINAEKCQLVIIKNPSQQFLPNVVEEFMNTFAVIISGFIQIFKPEIKDIRQYIKKDLKEISLVQIMPSMESVRGKIISLLQYLDPLLIELHEEITKKKGENVKPGFNIFSYILPGMAILFLLFIIEIFLRDILTEREDGKMQRMMFSPLHPLEFIFARVLSGWIMGILIFFIMVIFGRVIFNINWGNTLYLFILVTATCFWISAFFALLNGFFKNKNQAGAFAAPIILMFSAFGGSILPVSQLPQGIRWIAQLTPNHWFIQGSQQIRNGNFPELSILILLLTAFILFFFATITLRSRVRT